MTPADMAKVLVRILDNDSVMTDEDEITWENLRANPPTVNTFVLTDERDNSQFIVNVKRVAK